MHINSIDTARDHHPRFARRSLSYSRIWLGAGALSAASTRKKHGRTVKMASAASMLNAFRNKTRIDAIYIYYVIDMHISMRLRRLTPTTTCASTASMGGGSTLTRRWR